MSSEFPKEFEKTTEVLPFTKYGLSSIQEYKEAEKDIHQLEWLKKAGLTHDEINLYMENEAGISDQRKNIESNVMKEKLDVIYGKINKLASESESSDDDAQPSTSKNTSENCPEKTLENPSTSNMLTPYPDGHPMNNIKDIDENLFSHLNDDDMLPINKRRKMLRRLERKKNRILAQEISVDTLPNTSNVDRPGSLWDMRELPRKEPKAKSPEKSIVGPKKPTIYTVKDNKIVPLESVVQASQEDFRAVDIVMPGNYVEAQLLEGTKMCIDDIRRIERFKDYEPGIPSKILYIKNIAPSVTQEQLSLLFNQFVLDNGRPIDVHLMTGRMTGQAFVTFQAKDVAIQALEETNGTILNARPIIVEFGRTTNRIPELEDDDDDDDER